MLARVAYKVVISQATPFTLFGKNVFSPFFLWINMLLKKTVYITRLPLYKSTFRLKTVEQDLSFISNLVYFYM